jgi:hypothetical protein
VRAIVDRYLEACQGNGAWLIVPTRADVHRVGREIAERAGIVLGGSIGTFPHAMRWLVPELEAKEITPGAQLVLVRSLLRRMRQPLAAASYPGFPKHVVRTLSMLRAAEFAGSGSLAAALASRPDAERAIWRELLAAYGDALVEHGRVDAAAIDAAAVEAAEHATLPILVYGFDDFEDVQVRMLTCASNHVDVRVSLPYERGRVVFQRRDDLVKHFEDAGARVEESGSADFASPTLAQLERNLYEPTSAPIEPIEGSHDVAFVECCGDLQEAEIVVEQVARYAALGVPLDGIACLAAHPAASRPLLEIAFRRAGIPVTFETARGIHETPAGRAVLDLVDAAVDGDAKAFARFARSRVSGIAPEDAERWTLRIAAGVQGDGWTSSTIVSDQIADAVRERRSDDGAIDRLVACLSTLVPATPGDARLAASVIDGLERSQRALPRMKLSMRDAREIVRAMSIPAPDSPDEGAVTVAPIARVRTDRFDAVVVFGLHSGGFTPQVEEDDAPAVARELAYVACTRPRRYLAFVRQSATGKGSMRSAHHVWLELRRIFPKKLWEARQRPLDCVVDEPAKVTLASDVDVAVAFALGQAERSAEEAPAGLPDDVLTGLMRRAATRPRIPEVGDVLQARIDARPTINVTALERYIRCPAQWFIREQLLAEDKSDASTPQVVSSIVHVALSVLVPQWAAQGLSEEDADSRIAMIEPALQRATDDIATAFRAPTPAEFVRARLLIERIAITDHIYGATVETELSFGARDSDTMPPLQLGDRLLAGRIDRVDSDGSGRSVVIDYKHSSNVASAADIKRDGLLQPPLYWDALRQGGHSNPGAAVYRPLNGIRSRGLVADDGGFDIRNGFGNDRMDSDALEDVIAAARTRALDTIASMLDGNVSAAPRDPRICDQCGLHAICRIDEVVTVA